MKKYIVIALILCLSFVGCKKDSDWTPIELEDTQTTISPLIAHTFIRINGGSGDYSAESSDPMIARADVTGAYSDGTGQPGKFLQIITGREGETIITVTDEKSGLSAQCLVTVQKSRLTIPISDIRIHVDAEHPEAIETDLEESVLFPIGSRLTVDRELNLSSPGAWNVRGTDETVLAEGTYFEETLDAFNENFLFYPIGNTQILSSYEWRFTQWSSECGPKNYVYDIFIVEGQATRLNSVPMTQMHFRLYEDLTEYYRTEYPEAGVRSVARVYISGLLGL